MYKVIYKSDDFGRKGESATIVDYDGVRLYTIVFDNDELKEEYTCTEKDFTRIHYKVRGFEVCTGYGDVAIIPKRGSKHSAGYDFSTPNDELITEINAGETVKIMTGIKAYMLEDEYLAIHIRSSIGIKKNLILSNITGVIDSDFYNNEDNEGNICLAITNIGEYTQRLEPGERVAQGIFTKYLLADDDSATGERVGGIGSTGKQ